MQYVLVGPPALIIIIDILWKPTHVHQSKMRINIRPFVRRRLAAVVKTGPYKSPEPVVIRSCEPPPFFRGACPPWRGDVLVRYITPDGIFFIDTTCRYGASHFGAH